MNYAIWAEGFRATGESGTATCLGEAEADTFKAACKKVLDGDTFFNENKLTYWSCQLFDNEAEARKSFG